MLWLVWCWLITESTIWLIDRFLSPVKADWCVPSYDVTAPTFWSCIRLTSSYSLPTIDLPIQMTTMANAMHCPSRTAHFYNITLTRTYHFNPLYTRRILSRLLVLMSLCCNVIFYFIFCVILQFGAVFSSSPKCPACPEGGRVNNPSSTLFSLLLQVLVSTTSKAYRDKWNRWRGQHLHWNLSF